MCVTFSNDEIAQERWLLENPRGVWPTSDGHLEFQTSTIRPAYESGRCLPSTAIGTRLS